MKSDFLPSSRFQTTAWSLIRSITAKEGSNTDALNRLITVYWRPVFRFVRSKGYSHHQAEDFTQEFFSRILEKDWLRPATPERGRFRNFLLKLLTRFLSDQSQNRLPRQKRFEHALVSIAALIQDDDREYEPPISENPETIFMKQWATSLVAHTLLEVRRFYEGEGKLQWYEIFAAAHLTPVGANSPTQRELAERFGITRDKLRYADTMVKTRFKMLLREEIADQVRTEAETEAEIDQELREILDLAKWQSSDAVAQRPSDSSRRISE